jgi:hypothetical protein
MNCIHVGPVTDFLIDVQRIEKIFEQVGVRVNRYRMEGEYDCFPLAWIPYRLPQSNWQDSYHARQPVS